MQYMPAFTMAVLTVSVHSGIVLCANMMQLTSDTRRPYCQLGSYKTLAENHLWVTDFIEHSVNILLLPIHNVQYNFTSFY